MTGPVREHEAALSAVMELRDGVVPFGTREGLRHINLSIARGERVALMGPSGAGKTSLLRAIAGLERFTEGQLLVAGVTVTGAPPEQRRTVYLHQTPALFPHLSVLDNVAFPYVLKGLNRSTARGRARALLERMQLAPLAERAPMRLSGGERHRTALARALAADPVLLLLDEPFSALDPSLRAEIRAQVMSMLSVPGAPAVMVVTHDVDEAALIGDRVVILLDGRLAQCAPTSEVIRQPASLEVAHFLGVPNVVPGERDGAGRWSSLLGSAAGPGLKGQCAAVGWADLIAIGGPGGAGACATVVAVEHRGLDHVVRVRVGELELVGRAERDAVWQRGDVVSVALGLARPHLLPLDATTPTVVWGRDV